MADVTLAVVTRGADGKLYPARSLGHAERNRARWMIHNLHCRDGLSLRAAQRAMAESYGVRRSMGTICADLANFECPSCAPAQRRLR
jgi:hypothetical protein